MKCLDLFSGLGGWSKAFKERGHYVFTVDNNPRFGADMTADIASLQPYQLAGAWDVILASPPCECFSVASIGTHWNPDRTPKTDNCKNAVALLEHATNLITALKPTYFCIENPRGMMRHQRILKQFDRSTVTFCQYGESRMKPTDIWYRLPEGFEFRPACKNGMSCHESAPRGAKTGTQGIKGAAARAVIPYELSLEVCLATENAQAIARPQANLFTEGVRA